MKCTVIPRFYTSFFVAASFICGFIAPTAAVASPTGTISNVLQVDIDGDGLADPGDTVRFTADVTNPDPTPVDAVSVRIGSTIELPFTESSVTVSQGTVSFITEAGQRLLVANISSLAPSANATISFDVVMAQPETFGGGFTQCANGHIHVNGSFVAQLDSVGPGPIGLGSCVLATDRDDDEIRDSEEVCVNTPHSSPKLDQVIPSSGGPGSHVIQSTLNVANRGKILQAQVNITAKHTWVGDLKVSLTHVASGKTVIIMNRPGVSPSSFFGCERNDINAKFDTAGGIGSADATCNADGPALAGTLLPTESLELFDGEEARGDWVLRIEDFYPIADGGSLTQWCLSFETETNVAVEYSAPATALSNKSYLQTVTVTNNGPSDILESSATIRFAEGISGNSALLTKTSLGSTSFGSSSFSSFLPKTFFGRLGSIPVGESALLTLDLTPDLTYPYRDLVITSPSAIAGTYSVAKAAYGPDLTETGISTAIIQAELAPGFLCELPVGADFSGKIVLLDANSGLGCQVFDVVKKLQTAGAEAVIVSLPRISFFSTFSILYQLSVDVFGADPATVGIPVLGITDDQFSNIASAAGDKAGLIRANAGRLNWNIGSELSFEMTDVGTPTGGNIFSRAVTTELQLDSDNDSLADLGDLCPVDPAKNSPLSCGCGFAETDANGNGIADCLTVSEVRSRYVTVQSLLKKVRPVKRTGNKKKDKRNRERLKQRVSQIRTLLAEVDTMVASPVQPIVLLDGAKQISVEGPKTNKSIRAALRTTSEKFSKNKKKANKFLKQLLPLLPSN